MDRLQKAIAALHEADADMGKRRGKSHIHPLARLVVCMAFLAVTVSFSAYDLSGLFAMSLYLMITGIWEEIPVRKMLSGLRYLYGGIVVLGAFNLFYDRDVIFNLGGFPVTGGEISAISLICKGIFTLSAVSMLLYLIGLNGLCRALRTLGIPGGAVTVLLLTWRYLIVLLKEVSRMWQAYTLRAPGQRGIRMEAWGSFAGLLLLRSMDRAAEVYHSMLLRGYDGEFAFDTQEQAYRGRSVFYTACWLGGLVFLRVVPVFRLAGGLFLG